MTASGPWSRQLSDKSYPRPILIASVANLAEAWKNSSDSRGGGKAPGVDGQSASTFRSRLSENLGKLSDELRSGEFRFGALRFHAIPKKNGKHRILCIPSVRDRLVQRLLLGRLIDRNKDRLGIINDVSFGFIPRDDMGVAAAIKRAQALRTEYPWVLQTDIEDFFNSIDRSGLVAAIERRFRRSSLVPLIADAVSCELAKPRNVDDQLVLAASGLMRGRGLRQGMPLSPVLSNFFLKGFDRHCVRRRWKLVRYADDLILFFREKEDAKTALSEMVGVLDTLALKLPVMGAPTSKTLLFGPGEPIEFLGLEMRVKPSGICLYIPQGALERARSKIAAHADLDVLHRSNRTILDAGASIDATVMGYLQTYKLAENYNELRAELGREAKKAKKNMYAAVLGEEKVSGLSVRDQRLLGIASKRRRRPFRPRGSSVPQPHPRTPV